jgi:hypothetical protein
MGKKDYLFERLRKKGKYTLKKSQTSLNLDKELRILENSKEKTSSPLTISKLPSRLLEIIWPLIQSEQQEMRF